MTAPPRTSFIVPARNAAGTLERTLDSIAAQGDGDWEAIVVDDASDDDTAGIVARRAARDARIVGSRLTSRGGASGARNQGIGAAQGEYLVFLDSDDWIAPDHLEQLHAAVDAAPDAVAAYCDYQRVMPDGTCAPPHRDEAVQSDPLAVFSRTCAVAIHAVLVRRTAVTRAGGFDTTLRTCEDWDLWQRVARDGGRWVHVPRTLAWYWTHPSTLSQDMDRVLADARRVVERGVAASHPDWMAQILGHLALWYQTVLSLRGVDHKVLRPEIGALPAHDVDAIVTTLVDGAVVGLCMAPESVAAAWPAHGPHLTAVVRALGHLWQDEVAARRVQYALEHRLLGDAQHAAPCALTQTLALPVDLGRPATIAMPAGTDVLRAELHAGSETASVCIGAIGAHGPRRWLRLGLDTFGTRAMLASSGAALARNLTLRDGWHGARRGLRVLLHDLQGSQGPRRSVSHALRAGLASALAPRPGEDAHQSALDDIAAHARQTRPNGAATERLECAPQEDAAAGSPDRRAYWEAHFRTPDPWQYGSDYEREKYAIQLEMLPAVPPIDALELACAEGHFTVQLASWVAHLIAADIAPTALARARARCAGHANIDFTALDLATDPLPHHQDLIVCSEVLYYLDDEKALAQCGARLAAALKPGGHLITAHARLLRDDMTHTGFDWDHPWGAETIARVLSSTPGLQHDRAIVTELYRVDRFLRRTSDLPPATATEPSVEVRPIAATLDPTVARSVVRGGAVALRHDLRHQERHDRVPILAYHRVADDGPPALARYRVGRRAFAAQMQWLRRHGYHALVADELAWYLQQQQPLEGRPVMITFDDGYEDFALDAWPEMQLNDFRAEVFVVCDRVGACADWDRVHGEPAPLMDAATLSRLAGEGLSLGSHLATHRCAEGLSTRELATELLRSRSMIEGWSGRAPSAVAAPYGWADERFRRLAAECGYTLAMSTAPGAAALTASPMDLPRIEVRGDMSLTDFAATLEAAR